MNQNNCPYCLYFEPTEAPGTATVEVEFINGNRNKIVMICDECAENATKCHTCDGDGFITTCDGSEGVCLGGGPCCNTVDCPNCKTGRFLSVTATEFDAITESEAK